MRIIVACAFALMLVGCTDYARLFPLDPAAKQAGTPRIDGADWGEARSL